ncbi:MAG: ABC transporter permease [Gemmatimonadales bacterium]
MSLRVALALLGALGIAWATAQGLRRRGRRTAAGRRFLGHPPAALAIGVLAFFTTVALAAPVVAPYPCNVPLDIVALRNQGPSWQHPLGTDPLSRDLLSRLACGGRVSLATGALGALLAVTVGTAVGAAAGYYRRRVDAVLMRVVDVGLALPRILVLLMLVAVWDGLPLPLLVVFIGLTSWFGTSRLVRAEVLSVRERAFVDAARLLGAGPARVIAHHVLPNVAAPIVVSAALAVGHVLLLEAGLSFLGVGVRPPTASWGTMIRDGADYFMTAPWTAVWPGLAIALVVMALNAVADALRDALDPRREPV